MPKWVLGCKKSLAQKMIGKYLWIWGGDFLTPLALVNTLKTLDFYTPTPLSQKKFFFFLITPCKQTKLFACTTQQRMLYLFCNATAHEVRMQVKRNSVVVVNYHNKPRLALVRSLRPSVNKVNVMIYCFRNSSICSDWQIDPSDIVAVTNVSSTQFNALAKSYPNYAATDSVSKMLFAQQASADAVYPQYAAYRKHYGPRESCAATIARLHSQAA